MKKDTRIVCLGGGIGTVNLIRGIKTYFANVSVIISMADEGGSSGRLRRLFNMFPPGDLVSCMAAFYKGKHAFLPSLLTYRFPGNRYGKDTQLSGHKLGNLIMAGLIKDSQTFDEAIGKFQALFAIKGEFIPATDTQVSISAITVEGKEIVGEESIDLGRYNGQRVLESVKLHPRDATAQKKAIEAILGADVVIAGPGDLYTTILPVLIVKNIRNALFKSSAKKVFVINVANKPFETKGHDAIDYIKAVEKHLGAFPFKIVIVNNNHSISIHRKYHYHYVRSEDTQGFKKYGISLFLRDLVDEKFPLYHSSSKLAKTITDII